MKTNFHLKLKELILSKSETDLIFRFKDVEKFIRICQILYS